MNCDTSLFSQQMFRENGAMYQAGGLRFCFLIALQLHDSTGFSEGLN